MRKEDVVFHEDDEYVVMEEDGWKILLCVNHFKCMFGYDVENPDGGSYGLYTWDIYEAIEKLNELKREYKNERQ